MRIIFGMVVALGLAGMIPERDGRRQTIAAACALVPVLVVLAGQLGGP